MFHLRYATHERRIILVLADYYPLCLIEIAVDARCRVGGSDMRRGRVIFVGDVAEIPGAGPWIGVVLDEPVGKNDGSVGGKRYFHCGSSCGVFVRPEKIEVGEFAPLEVEGLDSDMEEM